MAEKQKIIILGGGVAGCTTAYWLTDREEWREKYDVELYQVGWRLGGKGASGRDLDTLRSYEHGPHAWYGGYENGFRMMRKMYKEYFDAFHHHGKFSSVTGHGKDAIFRPAIEAEYILNDNAGNFQDVWTWEFPQENLGQEGDGSPPPNTGACLKRMLKELHINIRKHDLTESFKVRSDEFFRDNDQDKSLIPPDMEVFPLIDRMEKALHEVINAWETGYKRARLEEFFLFGCRVARKILNQLIDLAPSKNPVLTRLDFMLALTYGVFTDIIRDGKNYDDLNSDDFQQWLHFYDAKFPYAADSPYVNGLYDAAFAYRNGKTRDLAAGTAIRISLWISFGYKSNYIYKMQAGMGEVVFSPLYKLLSEKINGQPPRVKFNFFHRVTSLELDPTGKKIARVQMRKQAHPIGEYQPLIDAKMPKDTTSFWCWPDTPKWDELKYGDDLSQLDAPGTDLESRWTRITGTQNDDVTLDIGENDIVVFAMPAPALKELVSELENASPKFGAMLDAIKSVTTVAAQLWIKNLPPSPRLWGHRGLKEELIAGGSANPASILLDYTPIEKTEINDPDINHLLYTCGVIPEQHPDDNPEGIPTPESDYPQILRSNLGVGMKNWLAQEGSALFPELADGNGQFNWNHLEGGEPDPMKEQYHRVNFDGSSRYILSVRNSIQHRLSPDQSGFSNLYLAGDWTKTGIDLGCVEAACTSGMMAVEAITGESLGIRLPLNGK